MARKPRGKVPSQLPSTRVANASFEADYAENKYTRSGGSTGTPSKQCKYRSQHPTARSASSITCAFALTRPTAQWGLAPLLVVLEMYVVVKPLGDSV
eukprot:UN2031